MAALFARIARSSPRVVEVWFGQDAPTAGKRKDGFGIDYEWKIPLRDGYPSRVLRNRAPAPNPSTFFGTLNLGMPALLVRERPLIIIIVGYAYLQSLLTLLYARCLRIPVVMFGEFSMAQHKKRSRLRRLLKRVVLKALGRQLSAALTIGYDGARFARTVLCLPASRVFIGPYSCDSDVFVPATSEDRQMVREMVRADWGVKTDDLAVLYVGKLYSGKRPMDLLEAISRLHITCRRKAVAVFVGDGEQSNALRDRAESLGVRAVFCGFVDYGELPKILSAGDALFCTSRRETWGMVVHEAMSVGLPIIGSSSVPSIAELVLPGVSGFVVDDGDFDAAARAIAILEGDSDLARRMGQNARRTAVVRGQSAATEAWLSAIEFTLFERGTNGRT